MGEQMRMTKLVRSKYVGEIFVDFFGKAKKIDENFINYRLFLCEAREKN